MTDGEGTRSYAKQLFKFRCAHISPNISTASQRSSQVLEVTQAHHQTYLKLENVINPIKLLLIPAHHTHTLAKHSKEHLLLLHPAQWHKTRCGRYIVDPQPSPPQDSKTYLAVNSSNVSSACWSLQRTALCEKARFAPHAMGLAR
jgi:hypothetical protein